MTPETSLGTCCRRVWRDARRLGDGEVQLHHLFTEVKSESGVSCRPVRCNLHRFLDNVVDMGADQSRDTTSRSTKETRKRLELSLKTLVDSVVVQDGCVMLDEPLVFDQFCKDLLGQDPWKKHLRYGDVFEIFMSQGKEAVLSGSVTAERRTSSLASTEREALCQGLQSFLLSLPRDYEVWLSLPSFEWWGTDEIRVAESLSFAKEILPETLSGKSKASKGSSTRRATKGCVFLKVVTKGYGGCLRDTTAAAGAFSLAKQLLQFAKIESLFYEMPKVVMPPQRLNEVCAYALDLNAPTRRFVEVPVSDAIREHVAFLKVFEDMVIARSTLTQTGKRRRSREKHEALREVLLPFGSLFDMANVEPESALRVFAGLEWLFDSEATEDQTLAFLQACIGLEAMLGDDDKDEPLMQRLADRCAFLLGSGWKERGLLRDKFKAIYKLRSKLVHGRRRRLEPDEGKTLKAVNELLTRVIVKEIEHLQRAVSRTTRLNRTRLPEVWKRPRGV